LANRVEAALSADQQPTYQHTGPTEADRESVLSRPEADGSLLLPLPHNPALRQIRLRTAREAHVEFVDPGGRWRPREISRLPRAQARESVYRNPLVGRQVGSVFGAESDGDSVAVTGEPCEDTVRWSDVHDPEPVRLSHPSGAFRLTTSGP
jgi:hypothetical protein